MGILLAFIAYAGLAWGDAAIKAVGTDLSVFEIGFFVGLFAILFSVVLRGPGERWRDAFHMRHPWLVQARAFTGIMAGLLGVYAFTTIPFAEAYALIFMAPFVVTILSVLLLKETVGRYRWLAMAAGFLGMLMVVRPAVRAVEPGHAAALAVALFSALTVIILRKISGEERRSVLLAVPFTYSIVVSGLLSIPGFVVPSGRQLMLMALSGVLGALGQAALLAATRRVSASTVGQAQYSQLIWAVLVGAVFYAEYPDIWTIVGLLVIAAAGIFTAVRQRLAERTGSGRSGT